MSALLSVWTGPLRAMYARPLTATVGARSPLPVPAILISIALVFLPGCRNGIGSDGADAAQPNIVLILVDDLGQEWISAYGAQDIETPNIDHLAREGILFENVYSMPQCTPTRVTLLTGQYPFRHGWTNHWDVPRWGAGVHFDPTHNLSFVSLLQEAGYATAIAGKWQINDFRVQPYILEDHGFDDWAVWTGFETGNPPSAERYWDPYVHTREGSRRYDDAFGPDLFVTFLEQFAVRHRQEPFFLYYPMVLTHPPLVATPDEPQADGMLPRHRAMVRYMDETVGRLLGTIDSLGLAGNTYVIFTTDNGTSRGIIGHLEGRAVDGGKGSLRESGIRAPFIVRPPGSKAVGMRTEALVDFTDLFPGILELAGVPVPDSLVLDGHSVAGLLRGDTLSSTRDWIMAMGFGPGHLTEQGLQPVQPFTDRAIRGKRYKLWIEDGRPTRLYDLVEDPSESVNIIDSRESAIVAARRKLEAVIASFPELDASPRYDPTPPQPWDRKPD